MRLRDTRGLNQYVVELLLLDQPDDLLHQVGLESATDATVLHSNHRLITLNQRRRIDQTLVNVQLGHVVDNDGTLEVLVLMLGLEDVLEQCRFAGTKESTEQGDRDPGVRRQSAFLRKLCQAKLKIIEILT